MLASGEDQRLSLISVSYTHLDVYKRQASLYVQMNQKLPEALALLDEADKLFDALSLIHI